jgi:hypothetical protein
MRPTRPRPKRHPLEHVLHTSRHPRSSSRCAPCALDRTQASTRDAAQTKFSASSPSIRASTLARQQQTAARCCRGTSQDAPQGPSGLACTARGNHNGKGSATDFEFCEGSPHGSPHDARCIARPSFVLINGRICSLNFRIFDPLATKQMCTCVSNERTSRRCDLLHVPRLVQRPAAAKKKENAGVLGSNKAGERAENRFGSALRRWGAKKTSGRDKQAVAPTNRVVA